MTLLRLLRCQHCRFQVLRQHGDVLVDERDELPLAQYRILIFDQQHVAFTDQLRQAEVVRGGRVDVALHEALCLAAFLVHRLSTLRPLCHQAEQLCRIVVALCICIGPCICICICICICGSLQVPVMQRVFWHLRMHAPDQPHEEQLVSMCFFRGDDTDGVLESVEAVVGTTTYVPV